MDWVVCASPNYLARAGRPQTPADLSGHDCLLHLEGTENDSIWRFEGPKGPATAKVRGSFFSNTALALRKAALAGLGIALVPNYVVRDDLESGDLVSVLPRYRVAPRPLIAVYPQAPVTPRKVQAFVDFLKVWMAEQNIGGRRRQATRITAEA
jgi:DNA-binding transcriptional LysR family regulator